MSGATATAPKKRDRNEIRRQKARAAKLRADGLTLREISEQLGHPVSTIQTWVGPRRRKADAIAPELLLEFLAPLTVDDFERGTLINGKPIASESATRAYFRWREENAAPSHATAEAFLHAQGLHMTLDFEAWAEERDRSIWASGEPPAGYRDGDDFWWQDLESTDPEFRAEALEQAAARGYELPEDAQVSANVRALLAAKRRKLHNRRQARGARLKHSNGGSRRRAARATANAAA